MEESKKDLQDISRILLLAITLRLKGRHKGFSAVLLAGGMAALYFIAYAACSFSGLFPQAVGFAMMFVLTAFTVLTPSNIQQIKTVARK